MPPDVAPMIDQSLSVVTISPARFHHFDLARQLNKHNALRRFYIGYPKFQLRKHKFNLPQVLTFPWLVLPFMALGQIDSLPQFSRRFFARGIPWTIDAFAAATMPQCDALIALSQSGLQSGRKVKKRGGIYVCDRGSSHIRYQNDIVLEEFRRWGDTGESIDPWVMEREEAEYDEADIITVPSSFVQRSFVERGVAESKLRRIPYGADLIKFSQVGLPESGCFNILFAGQIRFRKGVPDLLNAFDRLKHPNKRLRFAGSVWPEMKKYFERYPPSDKIEFLGHLSQSRLKEVMSSSHVLVLPSVEEGLALVMAQAMACGCPVVASVNSGAEDLFSDGIEGFIIPIRAPDIIADRLQRLADEPQLHQAMSAASLARVSDIGGWDTYGDEIMRVLTELKARSSVLVNA